MDIKASLTKLDEKTGKKVKLQPVVSQFNMPKTLAEKVKAWGEDVINAATEDSVVISVQSLSRRLQTAGKSAAEIQTAITAYRPDVRTIVRQSAFEKVQSNIDKLSPEERKQLLARLSALK